jgi:hypothetical protein
MLAKRCCWRGCCGSGIGDGPSPTRGQEAARDLIWAREDVRAVTSAAATVAPLRAARPDVAGRLGTLRLAGAASFASRAVGQFPGPVRSFCTSSREVTTAALGDLASTTAAWAGPGGIATTAVPNRATVTATAAILRFQIPNDAQDSPPNTSRASPRTAFRRLKLGGQARPVRLTGE